MTMMMIIIIIIIIIIIKTYWCWKLRALSVVARF